MEKSGLSQNLVDEIISYAVKYGILKLILFGSRARGDYRRASDIDLAFYGGEKSRFILSVSEDTRTLLNFDIVDMDSPVQAELVKAINEEGVVIYEKI